MPGQPIGVSISIPGFVMVANDRSGEAVLVGTGHDHAPNLGVTTHLASFAGSEWAGLVEGDIARADFANIVHASRGEDGFRKPVRHFGHFVKYQVGGVGDPNGVI